MSEFVYLGMEIADAVLAMQVGDLLLHRVTSYHVHPSKTRLVDGFQKYRYSYPRDPLFLFLFNFHPFIIIKNCFELFSTSCRSALYIFQNAISY